MTQKKKKTNGRSGDKWPRHGRRRGTKRKEKWRELQNSETAVESYRVLLGFTGSYWVLLDSTGFKEVSLGFTRLRWVFIKFYWVLLDLTGFCWILLGLKRFHLVLQGYDGFLLSFTGFYWILLGFIGFCWV